MSDLVTAYEIPAVGSADRWTARDADDALFGPRESA
jgi:hypothetical protein